MNDVTDKLEIFLENQKRKHINQGALGALGLVLISMILKIGKLMIMIAKVIGS